MMDIGIIRSISIRCSEMREKILEKPVKDLELDSVLTVKDLVLQFKNIGGFMASKVYQSVEIIEKMLKDSECTIFLSFTANLIATGLRSIFAEIIKKRFIDAIITTGGSIDHDIARSFGGAYYVGDFNYDDIFLKELNIHRLGSVLIPFENYGEIIEKKVHQVLKELVLEKNEWSPSELLKEFGKRINDRNSLLRAAYKAGIPIFSPGLLDSAFGTAIYTFNQKQRFKNKEKIHLNFLRDMEKISEIVFSSEKLGGVIIGGGISKHHVIWWAQFRGGLDYVVYITTAVEWDGSLSGARPREAVSWGKVKPAALQTTIYGDATIVLPLIYLCIKDVKRGKSSV